MWDLVASEIGALWQAIGRRLLVGGAILIPLLLIFLLAPLPHTPPVNGVGSGTNDLVEFWENWRSPTGLCGLAAASSYTMFSYLTLTWVYLGEKGHPKRRQAIGAAVFLVVSLAFIGWVLAHFDKGSG